MRLLVPTLLAGCATPPGSSGVPDACSEVAPLTYVACAETTAATDPPYLSRLDLSGSGTVDAVGGILDPVEGSTAIPGFDACSDVHQHQIRLVDADGETWTLGWDLSGPVDRDSSAPIEVDDAIDFAVTWALQYHVSRAIVLADEIGPLFVLVDGLILPDELRGGVDEGDAAGACVIDGFEYGQRSFSHEEDRVVLWPGEDAQLTGVRPYRVVLGDEGIEVGCADGCTADWWAEWTNP